LQAKFNRHTKKCCTCKEIKNIDSFAKNKTCIDGLQYECKLCFNIRNKKRRQKNKQNGLCICCGKELDSCNVTCLKCSKKHSLLEKNRKNKRKIEKKCTICELPVLNGHTQCAECLDKANKRSKELILKFSKKVGGYFNNICQICQEQSTHYEVFQCHHLHPSEKIKDVSKMVHKDWDSVVAPELEKCIYLCSNCHARLHAGRFDEDINSGKLILTPGKVEGINYEN